MRQSDEKVQKFILRIQTQAAKCDFGDRLDSALLDRLISGINKVLSKKKLLLLEDRTFLAARKLCVQYEELQKAVEEPQPAMYNSRLKSWRNAGLRGSKVQKRPEASPGLKCRSVRRNNRSSPQNPSML